MHATYLQETKVTVWWLALSWGVGSVVTIEIINSI